MNYIRVKGTTGTIIIPVVEYEKGLTAENEGVEGNIIEEENY